MKIKKVAALCRKSKRFHLWNQRNQKGEIIRQWLGDGCAMYALNGAPVLDETSLCALFDISEADRGKMEIRLGDVSAGINLGDSVLGEKPVERDYPDILYEDALLHCMESDGSLLLVDSRYLSPLDDMPERYIFGQEVGAAHMPYVVVKVGLLVRAMISTFEIRNRDYFVQLEELARKFLADLDVQKTRQQPGSGIILFDELLDAAQQ